MEGVLTAIFALLGVAVGSFLNVCSDRLPLGKSLVTPPSHCDACHHRLSPKELVPVFSYLWLRGRCRFCQAPIPRRILWVEISCGFLFAFNYWYYGLGFEFAVITFYCCLFLVLMVIDLEHKLILNKIVYPAVVVAVIISFFQPPLGVINVPLPWPTIASGVSGMVSSVIGGATGFILLLIPAIIYPVGIGWGDVKMAALIGLVTGFPLVFVALFTGIVCGGLVAGLLLLLKMKGRREAIPFAPFLSVATIVTLLWGSNILDWYMGFF